LKNTNPRILIVDDNTTNRRVLVFSLKKAGYEPLEACSGDEALELAESEKPDLILLDVDMPGMDGFEVCSKLKAISVCAEIPIIFITAKSTASDIERAFEVGGSDYVTKPFHITEVKARVSVHLQLNRTKSELFESHTHLLRAQKLESVGQLAAGVAHEINTPTQFIGMGVGPS